MEKYSAYRDPGTGIQPFLTPVPPQESGSLATISKPLLYLIGIIRTALVLALAILYSLLVSGFCTLLSPVPPLRRILTFILSAAIFRLSLFAVGLYWIPVEVVRRKRGRFAKNEYWSPRAGDVIVSNWISWLEIVWLALRFNPLFVLPVAGPVEKAASPLSSPSRVALDRKRGTGSAAISLPHRNQTQVNRAEVLGFVEVSLLRMVSICGRVPPYGIKVPVSLFTIDEIRQRAKDSGRPVAMFPECTTSNGRGLLRFSNVLKGISAPVKDFNVFVMCVRIDPPTPLSPTLSLPIPSPILNPIPHIFTISSSILPYTMSIRLLAPSDSPNSATLTPNEIPSGLRKEDDALIEVCSILMSDIGRVKRTGMGWEEKSMFLEFYKGKGRQ
ncbi:hypothetical protein ACEPAF_6630 [Sanghuangporus sanghuang]